LSKVGAAFRGQRGEQLVSWDMAGTDHTPFSCRRVRIDLSLDGGHTYPG